MVGLLVCYSLYPLAQGRFWDYHWLPCLYFLALLSALCVLPQPNAARVAGQGGSGGRKSKCLRSVRGKAA